MVHTAKLIALLLLVSFAACEDPVEQDEPAIIPSISVSGVTESRATLHAVIHNSGSPIHEKGFCWSDTKIPTVTDNVTKVAGPNLSLEATIDNLKENQRYFARAYAMNGAGVAYSDVVEFTTLVAIDDPLRDYVPPGYADDYSPIAGWHQRHQWNLANVHDPSVEKSGEYYYMYGTDASYGNTHVGHGHFPYRRSKDLVNWEFQGMTMPDTPPTWIKDSLNNMRARQGLSAIPNPVYGYWAPVVRKAGDKYRMYYSIVVDSYIATGKRATPENFDGSWTERAFIGLMETDDLGSNIWEDKGMVVCSSTDRGFDWSRANLNDWSGYFKWNAIDPTFIITPEGEHWLVYGSWHSGLAALQLDPATGKPFELGEPWDINALPNYGTTIYTRDNGRWQGSEAPEVVYNAETGYYYLFVAYDELSVAYNTRVLRSRNIDGPYHDFAGRNATGGLNHVYPIITHPYQFNNHSGWVGFSHNAVFNDGEENWFYASQARLPANTGGNAYSNAIMMGHVRKIRWTDDGWPVVMPQRYGAVPDVPIKEAELVGSWEFISLTYQYGTMNRSRSLVLHANKEVSGALSGTWSWDAENKVLTIGAQKLYLEREVDWEAAPRTHTLVFAGLDSSGISLWGKKN